MEKAYLVSVKTNYILNKLNENNGTTNHYKYYINYILNYYKSLRLVHFFMFLSVPYGCI